VTADAESLELSVPHWIEPLLKTDARYLGIWGGRGGGKSWAVRDLLIAEHVRNPHLSTVCLREVQRSLDQSSKRLLEQKIRDCQLEDYFDIKSNQIRSRKGSGIIIFQGLSDHTATSIKSFEGFDYWWPDEAQVISKRSWDILRPTVRKEGAKIIATWNPVNETDPVDVLFRGPNRLEDSLVIHANYYDNPWFPKSLLSEVRFDQQHDPEKYDHVWLGGYVKFSEARVFKNWIIKEFEAPKNAVLLFGVDWGFSPDPTVLLRGYVEGRELYIEHEAYQVECEIEDTKHLFLTVPQSELWMLNCASDRPERVKSIQRAGFKAKAIPREQHSIQEGVDFLRGFRINVHPRCTRTIAEMRLYSRKVDKLSGKVLPEIEDKHNHCIDAMRHLVDDVRRMAKAKPVPVVTPQPQKWGGR
jgi:phage terminase large subunit